MLLHKNRFSTEPIYAQKIKDKIVADNHEEDYTQFLFEKFQPFENRDSYSEFHISLIKLGFCGIVTTNYDRVLEIAIQSSPDLCSHECVSLDLCEKKSYSIFPFLRSLNSKTNHSQVLHLHGYYRNPSDIILTKKDYEKNYGQLDENDKKPQRPLDTIHRKVIWALLTTHPHLFVGFSLTDPYFLEMIRTVNYDFKLGKKCSHYAIMGYHDDIEMSRILCELTQLGICPIFYKIDINSDKTENHTRLEDLITDIEHSLSLNRRFAKSGKKPELDLNVEVAPSTKLPPLNDMNAVTGG